MAPPNHSPVKLTFGPFGLNTSTGELLKRGIRIGLPGQPFTILLYLLLHPGEVVTREQLRDQIWGEGTFVDFEHGLNAAIYKLRRALSDSAENPRYIETMPGRGYRFIGMLHSGDVVPNRAVPKPEAPGPGNVRTRSFAVWQRLTWAVGAMVCLAFALRFHNAPRSQPNFTLTRITADAGLSDFPALSPDGKLMAYSSAGGLNGEQDLYVRQVAGGLPVRLTFDGAGNTAPDFSADGTRIVFQSNRNGGGIYEVPALGGEARLLARGGLNPKYSPDGSLVAYWVGTAAIDVDVPGSGAVWVVPVSGATPRRIGANFTAARQPIWLPDGKRLLFVGYTSAKAFDKSAIDWWVVARDGDAGIRTGLYDALVRNALRPADSIATPFLPVPGCWSAVANSVIFSLGLREQADLWEIGLSPRTSKVNGAPRRLTTGTLKEVNPSCTREGMLAFTGVETTRNVWSLAFDLDRGMPMSKGTLEQVTIGPKLTEYASIANDGRLLTFASNQSGRPNIWVRDLTTGKESPLASSSLDQHYPVSSPSGARIAFSVFEKDRRAVYVSAPGGTPEKSCEGCLRATDWSRDEKTILVFGDNPYQIDALDVASHRRAPILKDPKYNLLYGRFSPDNRWVSFYRTNSAESGAHRHRSTGWAKTASRGCLDHNSGFNGRGLGKLVAGRPDDVLFLKPGRAQLFLGPADRRTFASPGG
ncbi:MAG TPA: winged helix-turn-helix domain-containing protein [Bryobacteraceae bacterium]|nr:winged helix-turn-helix domain-containing protein [Bryobacteraceae bacterium]